MDSDKVTKKKKKKNDEDIHCEVAENEEIKASKTSTPKKTNPVTESPKLSPIRRMMKPMRRKSMNENSFKHMNSRNFEPPSHKRRRTHSPDTTPDERKKKKKVTWSPEVDDKDHEENDKWNWDETQDPDDNELRVLLSQVYAEMIKCTYNNHFYHFNNWKYVYCMFEMVNIIKVA